MSSTALTTHQETALATDTRGFMVVENFKQAIEVAEYINKSQLVPDAYRGKPADIVIAMQYGMELGLSPLQALQSVAVINGKPSIYGDAVPAIVVGLPECEDIVEVEPTGDKPEQWVASCTVKRRGKEPKTRTFSWQDAQRAGLTNKKGPWNDYPKRMLLMRARGFAIRDAFPDRMKGMILAEEAQDYPTPEPERSEPRRVGESATPDAQKQSAGTPPASSGATPTPGVAPADVAAQVPAPAPQAATSVSSPSDEVWPGVKIVDTKWVDDPNGGYAEITTSRAAMMTRDKALLQQAQTCEGTDALFRVFWRYGKRHKPGAAKDQQERVYLLMKLELDEGGATATEAANVPA